MSRFAAIIAILAPIILGLVSAASALASGLFAIASAAAPAAGGLAILPGLALAAAGAFAVLRLAFGGIGGALSAGANNIGGGAAKAAGAANSAAAAADAVARAQEGLQRASEESAKAIQDADRRIVDSKRQLADTVRTINDNQLSNTRDIALAERKVIDAQTKARQSQIDVNKARAEAVQQMIDLKFQLQSGALSEEQAAINLEKARRQLELMQGLPPNNLLRREAELAYKEAQLNVAKTADSYSQLQKTAASQAGKTVDDSATVVKAKETERKSQQDLADAQFELADRQRKVGESQINDAERLMLAQRGVADAEKQRAQVNVDNSRRMADAQRALAAALRQTGSAAAAGGGGVNQFQRALDKLPPSAQQFVRYLLTLRGTLMRLKEAAASGVLPGVEDALKSIVASRTISVLESGFRLISGVLGDLARASGVFLSSPLFQGQLAKVFQVSAPLIKTVGESLGNLVRLMFSITIAAAPMTQRFADFIKTVTGGWADKVDANGSKLTAFFKRSGDVAAQLGRIIGNVAIGIFKLGQTAQPAGQSLLDSLEKATVKFKELTDADPAKFKKFFSDVAVNVKALGKLFNDLVTFLAKLGADPNIAKTSEAIRTKLLPVIENLLKNFSEKSGDGIRKLVEAIGQLLQVMSDSPALNIFVGIMTAFFTAVVAFASNPAGKAFLVFLVSVVASMKALSLIKKLAFVDEINKAVTGINKFIAKRNGIAPTGGGTGGGGGGAGGAGAGTAGATDAANTATTSFTANLARLATAFETTGIAKDQFILNLGRLAAAFKTAGAGGAAPAVAGRRTRPGGTNSAGAAAAAAAAGGGGGGIPPVAARAGAAEGAAAQRAAAQAAARAAADAEAAAARAAASGGRLSKAFAPVKNLLGGLATALFGVSGATLAAIAPFLIVAGAIAGLVFIVKLAYDRSETFRNAVDTKLRPAFTKLGVALKPIIDALKKFAEEALKKIGDFIGNYVIPALASFVLFLAEDIPKAISVLQGWIKNLVTAYNSVSKAVAAVKDFVFKKFNEIITFFVGLPAKISNTASSMWNSISTYAQSMYVKATTILFNVITYVTGLPGKVAVQASRLWGSILTYADSIYTKVTTSLYRLVTYVGGLGGTIANKASGMWNGITTAAGSIYTSATGKIGELLTYVGGLGPSIAAKASGMWDGIKTSFTGTLNGIIGLWNNLSFSLPSVTVFGQSVGGFTLNTPDIPYLAKGGVVAPTSGGTLAMLAEAGRSERVTPLDNDGLSKGERLMLNTIGKAGNKTVIIQPPPGMDITALARAVSRELGYTG